MCIRDSHKSHLILKVKDLEGFAAATSTPEMKEWDKENGYKDICYSLTPVEQNETLTTPTTFQNIQLIKDLINHD